MKNIKYIQLFLLLTVGFFFVSCDEGGDPDPGKTEVVDMAGDWYVQTYLGDQLALDWSLISTYNTSTNDGEFMWVDDHQNIWWFKVKTPVNVETQTFSGTALASNVDGYEITVDIINGIIEEGAATTSGGNTTDKISMDVIFSDDPDNVYTLEGYRRTGFLEDEH